MPDTNDPSITPIARALFLCDVVIGYDHPKTDLYGLFRDIRPAAGYPIVYDEFCVFAELANGLGRVACHVDIVFAADRAVVHTTNVYPVRFPNRGHTHQLIVRVRGCPFPKPGLYVVELYCNNNWVADTTVFLHDFDGGE